MTGCYAYCVLPAGTAPPPELRGIDGAPVRAVDAAGVTLWVSALPARPQPGLDQIRSHNTVIEAATDPQVTPVPLRFGQWLPDADVLAAHAAERAPVWHAQLETFAGCCELGIRIPAPPAAAAQAPLADAAASREAAASAGRAHMERLAAQHGVAAARRAHAERIIAALRARLGPLAVREWSDAGRQDGSSVAHLVRWHDVDAYRARVAEVAVLRAATLTITGPWPPYSFAE